MCILTQNSGLFILRGSKEPWLELLSNIKYQLCVFDYYQFFIMIFCLIAHRLCMTLAFVMRSIVKQCLSMGYISLPVFLNILSKAQLKQAA